jgi:hypothetical protein
VQDPSAFATLDDYFTITSAFLNLLRAERPTRIVSPSSPHYVFYQYTNEHANRITRPLNTQLFTESTLAFERYCDAFRSLITRLAKFKRSLRDDPCYKKLAAQRVISSVVYTVQQSLGCVGDSFENQNQSRKRIGQLFENLVAVIIRTLGIHCEPRTINLPIPGYPGYQMSYELDLVFSRKKAILSSETKYIHASEVVGSVKTTSKDRIDKVFLDKYLLTKLLGREIPVIAVFLHDVQRARKGNSIFGINSTFKSNHFLGYTVALNRLDGVYYVDPRPEMLTSQRLKTQIADFERFVVHDLWTLTS